MVCKKMLKSFHFLSFLLLFLFFVSFLSFFLSLPPLHSLFVTDPPEVSILGYDDNWYIGRTDASLECQHDANPLPTTVEWTV